jgi:hypothetical protein
MSTDAQLELFVSLIKTGRTRADAVDTLKLSGLSDEDVKAILVSYDVQVQRIKVLREPFSMRARELADWYPGPSETDPCWPLLKRYLLEEKKWHKDVVDSVDGASTKIVSLLSPPGKQSFQTRGLVLGYVQSGKTANFTAVISKAADAGYKLFIVLSGLHNGLRRQTQERLELELSSLRPDHWHSFTSAEKDFEPPAGNAAAFLAEHSNHRVLCVMKKNGTRLRKLLRWLRQAPAYILDATPVLVIDDEADQASVDTKGTESPSTINKLILDVLRKFNRSAYLAYTATPFANVLSDPKTADLLYPRDFIVDLPRSAAYFGAERIFGAEPVDHEGERADGLDMIREVPAEEVTKVQPANRDSRASFVPELVPTLERALLWFLLGCAVRRARGQADQHMSMLVHTTLYANAQQRFEQLLVHAVAGYRTLVQGGDTEFRTVLEEVWNAEATRVDPIALGEAPVSFESAVQHLLSVLSSTRVIVDNGSSETRLDYPKGGSTTIVVGGNTLSRGLTIEGLMVSYFVRTTTMYDALLQMGRWFGYRKGYADLPRIWMTSELEAYFIHLATVERELRQDIERYEREGITPADFAPRIRSHSTLAITSPLKLRYAVDAEISFARAVKQTTYFNHLDQKWLEENEAAARTLLRRADERRKPETVWSRHRLWRDIKVASVVEFLERYEVHPQHADLRRDLLLSYIAAQNETGELLRWNVGLVGQTRTTAGDWSPGVVAVEKSPLLVRSRYKLTEPANLKAIMSTIDRGIDLSATPPATGKELVRRLDEARSAPGFPADPATGKNTPLLLLYPISKESRPDGDSTARHALNAASTVIGLALVFPNPQRSTPQSYVTADLSRIDDIREEPDDAFVDEP